MLSRFLLSILLLIGTVKCYSQKNYFYTSVKVPFGDYVAYLITRQVDDNEYNKTDGALFDFGYGVHLKEWFVVETGVEAFFFNPLNKRYYSSSRAIYNELNASNKAFAIQVKPVLCLALSDDVSLRAAYGLNYRQLYSSGNYYINQAGTHGQVLKTMSSASSKSRFSLNLQPVVGLDFKLNDDWGIGFDLTYVRVNWNKTLDDLKFKNQPDLIIPDHQTSNLFFSGRILFR